MAWENVVMDQYDDSIPRARAGHCSVAVSVGFLYWSCYMKQWEVQWSNKKQAGLSIKGAGFEPWLSHFIVC